MTIRDLICSSNAQYDTGILMVLDAFIVPVFFPAAFAAFVGASIQSILFHPLLQSNFLN